MVPETVNDGPGAGAGAGAGAGVGDGAGVAAAVLSFDSQPPRASAHVRARPADSLYRIVLRLTALQYDPSARLESSAGATLARPRGFRLRRTSCWHPWFYSRSG